jgi:ABC-2 type transport system permease protein
VVITALIVGVLLFGTGHAAAVGQPGGLTSLSGNALSPNALVLRLLGAIGYIVLSMLGVGAVALLFSTLTDSALGAALGTLAVLIASEVLDALDAASSVRPYLLTNYWLSWVDFFRDPVFWNNIERGAGLQVIYIVVLLGAAWANFTTKDITS